MGKLAEVVEWSRELRWCRLQTWIQPGRGGIPSIKCLGDTKHLSEAWQLVPQPSPRDRE